MMYIVRVQQLSAEHSINNAQVLCNFQESLHKKTDAKIEWRVYSKIIFMLHL